MSKIIGIRVEEKTIKKIDDFCKKNEIKQTKLIKTLIDNFFSIQDELKN